MSDGSHKQGTETRKGAYTHKGIPKKWSVAYSICFCCV